MLLEFARIYIEIICSLQSFIGINHERFQQHIP